MGFKYNIDNIVKYFLTFCLIIIFPFLLIHFIMFTNKRLASYFCISHVLHFI